MNPLKMLLVVFVFLMLLVPAAAEDRATIVKRAIDEYNADIPTADRAMKYNKMADSPPFVFYRGTNHLFWQDFTTDPKWRNYIANSAFSSDQTKTWIQGDLHAYNFGSFDNDQQTVIYDLNDFDESIITDYQFDVWRMAVSLVLIGRLNKTDDGGRFTDKQLDQFVDAFTGSYLKSLAGYVGNDEEEKAEFTKENTSGKLANFLKDVGKPKPKAAREKMLEKWTKPVEEKLVFKCSKETKGKLDDASPEEKAAILKAMKDYGQTLSGKLDYEKKYFKVKDISRRLLAGTGSLGVPRFYVLIEGQSEDGSDDRILDVKRQEKPSAYKYLSAAERKKYDDGFRNDAQRHAEAYDALSKDTDDHLGWMFVQGVNDRINGFYSVRERSPYKESYPAWQDPSEDPQPEFELTKVGRFKKVAGQWGEILAAAHARADNDFDDERISYSFEKQVVDVVGDKREEFRDLVREIATAYATQVVEDWQSWKATVETGR